MDIGSIVALIVIGAVIGALARLALPGKQDISLIATIVIGIVGTLMGYWLSGLLGVKSTNGIDWIRWAISIAVSAGLVALYSGVAGRSNTRSVR